MESALLETTQLAGRSTDTISNKEPGPQVCPHALPRKGAAQQSWGKQQVTEHAGYCSVSQPPLTYRDLTNSPHSSLKYLQ